MHYSVLLKLIVKYGRKIKSFAECGRTTQSVDMIYNQMISCYRRLTRYYLHPKRTKCHSTKSKTLVDTLQPMYATPVGKNYTVSHRTQLKPSYNHTLQRLNQQYLEIKPHNDREYRSMLTRLFKNYHTSSSKGCIPWLTNFLLQWHTIYNTHCDTQCLYTYVYIYIFLSTVLTAQH